MKNILLAFGICSTLLFFSCDKQNTSSINCDELVEAMLDKDAEALQVILDPELANFTLLDQDNDLCLFDNSLKAFRDFLNDSCDDLNASILCCSCIDTAILLSEVKVLIDSSGVEVTRVLDLYTPDEEGMPLSFAGIHN